MKQNLTLYDFPQEVLYFKQLCVFELVRLSFKKLHTHTYIYIYQNSSQYAGKSGNNRR